MGMVLLLTEPVLQQQMVWINETLSLQQCTDSPVDMTDVLQFFSIFFYSQTTSMSPKKTIELFDRLGHALISIERYRLIQSKLCAYSPTRDSAGNHTWFCQRDKTHLLTSFENVLMPRSRSMFFVPLHQVVTLDDDLMGTRSAENPVKTLSNRKADKEGHSTDVVADAFFRIVLAVRFRRRGRALNSPSGEFFKLLWRVVERCLWFPAY